jgi:hypothetical protein
MTDLLGIFENLSTFFGGFADVFSGLFDIFDAGSARSS